MGTLLGCSVGLPDGEGLGAAEGVSLWKSDGE